MLLHYVDLEPKERSDLLKNVRSGDQDAFERMILGHMKYAYKIVNDAAQRYDAYYLIDELFDSAIEGILIAVDRIRRGKLDHDNFTTYIGLWVKGQVSTTLRSFERRPTKTNKILSRTDWEVDFWDQVFSLAENAFERNVLTLRSREYTDKETAEKLNVSASLVFRTRCLLKNRYSRKAT